MREFNHCLRCGRLLKSPKARAIGYGAICQRKGGYHSSIPLFHTERSLKSNGEAGHEISNRVNSRAEGDI